MKDNNLNQEQPIFSFKIAFISKIAEFFFFKENLNPSFPKRIGNYSLVKEILKERVHRPFRLALYQNSHGEEAIAKQWVGKIKSFDYYSLLNEIKVYEEINQLYLEQGRRIIKAYPYVKIPKLISYIKKEGRVLLLVEKIKLSTIESLNLEKKISIYESVISYFRYLGIDIVKNKFTSVTKRNTYAILFICPFLFLKTLIRYPKISVHTLRGLMIFFSISPLIIHDQATTFVHKSLEHLNILSNGKTISIIDYQMSVIAHPIFELTQILVFSWRDTSFCKAFLKTKTMQEVLSDKKSFSLFKAFSIYSALMQLSFDRDLEFNTNYAFLKYSINLRNNHES